MGQVDRQSTGGEIETPVDRIRPAETDALLACSPDDPSTFAVAPYAGKEVSVWDLATRRLARTIRAHAQGTTWLSFVQGGRLVTAGRDGGEEWVVKLWDEEMADASHRVGLPQTPFRLAVFPDNKTIAAFRPKFMATRTVEVERGTERTIFPTCFRGQECGGHSAMALSPDGSLLAIGTRLGFIALCDATTGEAFVTPLAHGEGWIWELAFSPDGNTLVSASDESTVKLWDVRDPSAPKGLRTIDAHSKAVCAVAFSPDGRTLATAGGDCSWFDPRKLHHLAEIRLWDVATGERLVAFEGHTEAVVYVQFTADGKRLATCGGDCKVYIWDVAELIEYGKAQEH